MLYILDDDARAPSPDVRNVQSVQSTIKHNFASFFFLSFMFLFFFNAAVDGDTAMMMTTYRKKNIYI